MWDRARASATAGLDRMHRRHLTGTAGGFGSTSITSYNDRPGADKQHASDAATPMSWTTISTSTSSSTFYQTNVDGPANALGIEVVANAAAPQRPQRPQADAPSARVTSALHTGMYVYCDMADVLVFPFDLSVLDCTDTHNRWRWLRHARYLYLSLSLHAVRLPALEPYLPFMSPPHSPMSIICPPSQRHIPVAC